MLSNNGKAFAFLISSIFLFACCSVAFAQTTIPTETTVGDQVFHFEDVNAKIQGNAYDINENGFIDTVDKYVFVDFFQALKAFSEEEANGDTYVRSLFDLNGDDAVDSADIKICRYFDRKLKRGYGLKIVSLDEVKNNITQRVSGNDFVYLADINGDGMVNVYDRNVVKDYSKRMRIEMRSNTVRNPRSVDNGEPVYYCEEAQNLTVLEMRRYVANAYLTGCDLNTVPSQDGYTNVSMGGVGAMCDSCEGESQNYQTDFSPAGSCIYDCQENGTGWYEYDGFLSFDSEQCCGRDCGVINEAADGLMYYDPTTQTAYENTAVFCSSVGGDEFDLNGDGLINRDDSDIVTDFYKFLRENHNTSDVDANTIKDSVTELSPDLNNDGVVNLTDRLLYRIAYKELRKIGNMAPGAEGWNEDLLDYDYNGDGQIDVNDKRFLKEFYKILKIQYKYQYATLGEFVYDPVSIKANVAAGTVDLNGDSIADYMDVLIYRAYYANLKSHYRKTFTPGEDGAEPQIWEHANFDLNNDNAINSLDKRELSSFYKSLRLAVKERYKALRIK